MENPADLKHRTVNFQIRHVYIPDHCEVLTQLYGDEVLQGQVLDVTPNGGGHAWFAVIQVAGVKNLLIVPVEQILCVL